MPPGKGKIVLMGSGELASTMVEVHKELLFRLGPSPRAVFVDTPAGFQLNADEISGKAVDYFSHRVQHPLTIASLKSAETMTELDTKTAYGIIESADYILIGPGSPSYAARQWRKTRMPDLFIARVEAGACLVTASAAALTLGRFTLPVYEIYKVGEDLHWISGIDLLNHFGFNLAVIPHWNNADGGTHDTRFCFMGMPRMDRLMALLPSDVRILGIDEHTACVLDLENNTAEIKGIGGVTLKGHDEEIHFKTSEIFSLDVLRPFRPIQTKTNPAISLAASPAPSQPEKTASCHQNSTTALNAIEARVSTRPLESLNALTESLLDLRAAYRNAKQFKEADAIRKCLEKAGIRIEDRENQSFWRLED
jgi:cyanophycinase-like exopeptidase